MTRCAILSLVIPAVLIAHFLRESSCARIDGAPVFEENDSTLPYYERSYSTGWFTSPILLNTRMDASQFRSVISKRARTHYPAFISAYSIYAAPEPLAFFNVLWKPNSDNLDWVLSFNLGGDDLQDALTKYSRKGFQPAQIESYALEGAATPTILYAALFYSSSVWPPGTHFHSAFAVPLGDFCCGTNSRWAQLQQQGYRLLSLSLTEYPGIAHRDVLVADVWNSERAGSFGWRAGFDLSPANLREALSQLHPSVTPNFLKAYYRTDGRGQRHALFAYIATSTNVSTGQPVVTTDQGRDGFELLSQLLKKPPLFVTALEFLEEADASYPITGEMYSTLWSDRAT